MGAEPTKWQRAMRGARSKTFRRFVPPFPQPEPLVPLANHRPGTVLCLRQLNPHPQKTTA